MNTNTFFATIPEDYNHYVALEHLPCYTVISSFVRLRPWVYRDPLWALRPEVLSLFSFYPLG